LQYRLDEVNITCNKNGIPYDPEKPTITSGVRLGTPAVTSRGMTTSDMDEIADLISLTLTDYEGSKADIIKRVDAITSKYTLYPEY
jgi:glycine hydroxymethyltransferase